MREDMHPMDKVRTLNAVFFSKYKFGANTKQFHAITNSMLNVVLESKKGNPISLCVIYMLIAQKLGLPIYGVNLPNLFILTYQQEKTQFYINVFNKGLVFSKVDIDHYIAQLNIPTNEIFYKPCEHFDIMRRVLRNIIVAFEKVGDEAKVKEIQQVLDEFL
jgi:regulator of sirC expression with transglutaminase-like and TPR domain